MKRIYDTIVIFDTAIDETTIDQKIQKIEGVIKTNEGEILKTEKWHCFSSDYVNHHLVPGI